MEIIDNLIMYGTNVKQLIDGHSCSNQISFCPTNNDSVMEVK